MNENSPTNVFAAFEILLEEIEAEIDFINKAGSKALEGRDYDSAREAIEHSTQATVLRDKLVSLRKEWESRITFHQIDQEEATMRSERRSLGRLQRGLRTPEAAYYQPILKALIEHGRTGKMNDILETVERSMKGILMKVDYQPLTSDPEMLRWRNTAQWARNAMVKEGLLKSDSKRGIWEITEDGRQALIETHR